MNPIADWFDEQRKPAAPTPFYRPEGEGGFGGAAAGAPKTPYVPPTPTMTPAASMPIGGFTPDYGSLIKSDPGYQTYLANGRLDVGQAASQRRASLQKLAIQYGGLPAGIQDTYGDLDAGTMELAGKNVYSDRQRLDRSYSAGIEAFKRSLAARGALQSGDLGHGLSQADLARGQGEYDLGNQFANAAQGTVNDYLGVESRVRQGESGALTAAQGSVYSNPANRPVDAYDAPLVEGSVDQYGQPVYRGKDGKLYTADGKEFFPPAPVVAAPAAGPQDSDRFFRANESLF